MTLSEFRRIWPHAVDRLGPQTMWTPDDKTLSIRERAFQLRDYVVVSSIGEALVFKKVSSGRMDRGVSLNFRKKPVASLRGDGGKFVSRSGVANET